MFFQSEGNKFLQMSRVWKQLSMTNIFISCNIMTFRSCSDYCGSKGGIQANFTEPVLVKCVTNKLFYLQMKLSAVTYVFQLF